MLFYFAACYVLLSVPRNCYANLFFAILKTNPQVATDKKEALNNVLPIYNYDEDVYKSQIEVFINEFDVKWKSDGFLENEKERCEGCLIFLFIFL